MSGINEIVQWFAGGSLKYHDLAHCMRNDTLWIAITVMLDLAVAAGYVVIAFHWGKNEPPAPQKPCQGRTWQHAEYLRLLRHLRIHLHSDQNDLARLAAV